MIKARLIGGFADVLSKEDGIDVIVELPSKVAYYDIAAGGMKTPTLTEPDPEGINSQIERYVHKESIIDSELGEIEIYEFSEVIEVIS